MLFYLSYPFSNSIPSQQHYNHNHNYNRKSPLSELMPIMSPIIILLSVYWGGFSQLKRPLFVILSRFFFLFSSFPSFLTFSFLFFFQKDIESEMRDRNILPLLALLIQPVQRCPRYVLLLKVKEKGKEGKEEVLVFILSFSFFFVIEWFKLYSSCSPRLERV